MNFSKNIYIFICILLLTTPIIKTTYNDTIQEYAHTWAHKYIIASSNEEAQIIIDLLLLSYQIVQNSCQMIIAKFTIQEEVFKIYTPSFVDSWHDNLQINQNDTTKLEQALNIIKESQTNVTHIYDKFKQLLPFLITINPQPTQTLISDIKQLLIGWGRQQDAIPNELLSIQAEFAQAITTISDIKNLFTTVLQSSDLKQIFLKEAAGFFSKTYHDIDHVIKHLTQIRIQNVFRIQSFFKNFFESYYTAIYQLLTSEQHQQLSIFATKDSKLPLPGAFFASFDTL